MNRFIKRQYFLFLFPALLAAGTALAQPTAHVYLETDHITIGQQVNLVLEVRTAANGQVGWMTFPDTLKTIEIVDAGKIDTIKQRDSILYRQKLLITSFDAGKATIPALAFTITGTGPADTILSKPAVLNVSTVAVDTTQPFKPIKDIELVEASSGYTQFVDNLKNNWKLYTGILLLAGLIISAIIYFLKNKKTKAPENKLPPEKPHEKAQRLLNELVAAKLWEQGRIKEYYSALSDIIRNYLEERYGVAAMEQTTDELLVLAKNNREVKKVRQELKKILRTADLAKFAKANPLPEEHISCMDAAYEVIKRTKIKEEVSNDQ